MTSLVMFVRREYCMLANDIWFGNSTHWDGQRFHNMNIADAIFEGIGSNRMWGSPSGNCYVVGNSGVIAFSSNRGGTWQRLQSGTTSIINDVWGVSNPVRGQLEAYCAVSAFFAPDADRKILRIQNAVRVDTIPWGLGRNIFGIWSGKGFPLFTAGSGVFENSSGRWRETPIPRIFTNAICGSNVSSV